MPKENTHLYFAYKVLDEFEGRDILKDISGYYRHYLLGSIIPDTFYYGTSPSLVRISEAFHGKTGNITNTTIIQVLDHARHPKDIAFILGYISHCALDITFHPVIYYLSGNYYDESPDKREHAVYLHRHLETCLDVDLKNTMRLHRLISVSFLKGLIFEEIVSAEFKVPIRGIRSCLRRQIAFNLLFTSTQAYWLSRAAALCGLLRDPARLGLFYSDATRGEGMPPVIRAADLIDNSQRTTTASELFHDARMLAKTMMETAYGYWKKTISRDELEKAIPGLSLDTGKLGVSASGIRHTRDQG